MEHEIREIINRGGGEFYDKYFKNHLDDWNVLCTSMDTIGDTTMAIQNFEKDGVGADIGEQYLRLYGLMQAVYLQQDAVEFLFKLVQKCFDKTNNLKMWTEYSLSGWQTLRSCRNLSSGHPIENKTFEKGKTKRAFISRVTISSSGFQLVIYDANSENNKFQYVKLKELIDLYLLEAKIVLTDLERFLKGYEF